MPKHWTRAGAGVAALLLLLLLWEGKPALRAPAPSAASAPLGAPAARPAAAGTAWHLAAQATAQADEAERRRRSPEWDDTEPGRHASAAWCAQAQRWAAQPAAQALTVEVAAQMSAQLESQKLAGERVLRRWAAYWQAQSGERAQALADFLRTALDAEDRAARQRLREAAQRANDPMVIALALQRCGEAAAACREAALRWTQLEPANLQAWLFASAALPHHELMRGLLHSRESRPYVLELMQHLLASPQANAAGLRDGAEALQLMQLRDAWALPDWRAVMEPCHAAARHAGTRQQCLGVAERIWGLGDEFLITRALAIRLAAPQGAASDPRWRDRANQTEAAMQWSATDTEARLRLLVGLESCDPQRQATLALREQAQRGEWSRLQVDLQRAGDAAALAAQRRARTGRSLLDALPARVIPAASAAGG